MHGVIWRFASYRRDPLLGTYREGRVADHVGAVECVRGWTRTMVAEPRMPACHNFLYCIKTADQILAKAVRKPSTIGESGHWTRHDGTRRIDAVSAAAKRRE
jgi:hypothetical protein